MQNKCRNTDAGFVSLEGSWDNCGWSCRNCGCWNNDGCSCDNCGCDRCSSCSCGRGCDHGRVYSRSARNTGCCQQASDCARNRNDDCDCGCRSTCTRARSVICCEDNTSIRSINDCGCDDCSGCANTHRTRGNDCGCDDCNGCANTRCTCDDCSGSANTRRTRDNDCGCDDCSGCANTRRTCDNDCGCDDCGSCANTRRTCDNDCGCDDCSGCANTRRTCDNDCGCDDCSSRANTRRTRDNDCGCDDCSGCANTRRTCDNDCGCDNGCDSAYGRKNRGVGMVWAAEQELDRIFESESALRTGTLFPELHKPLNGYCPADHNCADECQEAAFAAWELRLYLNTHPDDEKALALFRKLCAETGNPNYATSFLTDECCSACWDWVNDPWPWECGANGN